MPFTINGDWIPNSPVGQKPSKPVKVRQAKRGKNIITTVLNLNMREQELYSIASQLKKKLACGGAVKEGTIEIQGDKVELVKKALTELGIKST
ncbi:MAG: translation initiation factor [Parachlamydiaceae bacterium]